MPDIRSIIKNNKEREVLEDIEYLEGELSREGLNVEFGKIGSKTTYALIYSEDHEIEYVGYTFIRNTRYFNENVGKLKALQQALARRETMRAE